VTSYRDLAEADAFQRRRLVTAFISGTQPGDRAEAPPTCRCLVGGLVLVAVLVAGAVVSGALTGHPAVEWDHGAARISR
jgi:hypothetical protein